MTPTLTRVLGYTKVYWYRLFLSGITATFYGMSSAAPSYIIQHVIDSVFVKQTTKLLLPFITCFIVLFILKGIFMYLSNYYMNWVGCRVMNDIRYDLFKRIVHFPISFFQEKTTGTLIAYFISDIGMIQSASSAAIRNGLRSFFEALFLLGVAFWQNPPLTLLLLCLGPIVGYTIKRMGERMRTSAHRTQDEMGNITSFLQEVFVGIREIKSFNAEHIETNRFAHYLHRYFMELKRNVRSIAFTPALIEIVAMSSCGLIFYLAARQVLSGTLTQGQVTSFFASIILAYQPLKRLINVYADVQTGLTAARRVFEIMDLEFPTLHNRTERLTAVNHNIRLENVSFAYDTTQPILTNVNFTISKGESIGIIGPSGCGKSTLCDLLLGFIEPTSGTIYIDGQDIRRVTFESLREHIGYVGQRTFLFNDTIAANIAYAQGEYDDHAVHNASKAAHVHSFVSKLAHGYKTFVGENGTKLSGGQKQRLTIARALMKQPEILIFDEATSALDQQSEHIIQAALQEICKSKTVIVISHRVSFVKNMDKVITFKQGKLIELRPGSLEQELQHVVDA